MEELIGIADFYFYTALFIYSACGRQEFGDWELKSCSWEGSSPSDSMSVLKRMWGMYGRGENRNLNRESCSVFLEAVFLMHRVRKWVFSHLAIRDCIPSLVYHVKEPGY
jgi:hypothetical protein